MPEPENPDHGPDPGIPPEPAGTRKAGKLVPAVVTLLLLAGLCLAGANWFLRFIDTPANPEGGEIILEIRPGDTFRTIAALLEKKGVISSGRLFGLLARYRKVTTRLKAGEYRLSPAMTPAGILDILVQGRVLLHRITVPEGLTFREIAGLAEQAGFSDSRRFMDLCAEGGFLASLGIGQPTLEGYLFPETYFFTRKASPEEIIRAMVARFNTVFTPGWRQRAADLGMDVHQVVTLASIIEKETGDPSERPLIASVFHNRLNRGMRLESDPTVIYGIKDFQGDITRRHLREPTPYNTYLIRGLPPGPIASPGRASLEAALFPADSDYLFFVSRKDTTHAFSGPWRNTRRP
jgi:UPF0755 protein